MEPSHRLHSAFTWEKGDFLRLRPIAGFEKDGRFVLKVTNGEEEWTIDFVRENNEWKIDWIAGYRPGILDIQEKDAASKT